MYKDGIYTSIKKSADVRSYLVHWKRSGCVAALVTGPCQRSQQCRRSKAQPLT